MNLSSKIQMITGGNKQAATFLLFVLLSAVIWTINALSKDQITTIHIPITYPGEQSQELQSGLPHELIFNAKGKGFFLMQFMTKTENFRIVPKSISNPLRDTVISSLQALAPVLEDFQGKIEIRNLQPEQLLLSGRKMFSKKVAIQPRFRATYLPAFVQKGPAITTAFYCSVQRRFLTRWYASPRSSTKPPDWTKHYSDAPDLNYPTETSM